MVTYALNAAGTAYIVRHNGRFVQKRRTLYGARSAAVKVAARFGCPVRHPDELEEVPEVISRQDPMPSTQTIYASLSEWWPELVDRPIAELAERLSQGDLDSFLDEIEAAERAGRNRKGALAVIEARR